MQGSAQNIIEDPAKLSKFASLESPLVDDLEKPRNSQLELSDGSIFAC